MSTGKDKKIKLFDNRLRGPRKKLLPFTVALTFCICFDSQIEPAFLVLPFFSDILATTA